MGLLRSRNVIGAGVPGTLGPRQFITRQPLAAKLEGPMIGPVVSRLSFVRGLTHRRGPAGGLLSWSVHQPARCPSRIAEVRGPVPQGIAIAWQLRVMNGLRV